MNMPRRPPETVLAQKGNLENADTTHWWHLKSWAVVQWLTSPSKALEKADAKREAQFLASWILFAPPALFFAAYLESQRNPAFTEVLRLNQLLCGPLVITAYILARTKHYRLGAVLAVLGMGIGCALALYFDTTSVMHICWMSIQVLIAATVLSLQATLMTAVVTLSLPFIIMSIQSTWFSLETGQATIFLAIVSVLALSTMRHRTLLEKERSQALLDLKEQLIATDRMVAMGTLAAGVAHEINNPLAYVIANRDLLEDELINPSKPGTVSKVNRRLTVMAEGLERVRSIVADLNTYAKPEATPDISATANLSEVIQAAVSIAGNAIRNRATLHQGLRPNTIVQANQRRLEQVLINVLVNAAQAIPEGDSANQHIDISVRTEENLAVIDISDTGAGISPEHIERVFDPFYTTKPVGEGTGLGLAISQSIIAKSGGSIAISSVVGEGTTVSIRLPRTDTPVSNAATSNTTKSAPHTTQPPARILVIDDEPAIRELLVEMLAPHQIDTAPGANEALEHLNQRAYDLILCDISMPGMSGIDFLKTLESSNDRASENVIFLTGGAVTAKAAETLSKSRHPVITKPFRFDEVHEIVRQQLATKEDETSD